MTHSSELREYGLYIRQNQRGTYNLGWLHSSPHGRVLATFPTYKEAYGAAKNAIDYAWEGHAEGFIADIDYYFLKKP